jgi:hypothetical protein
LNATNRSRTPKLLGRIPVDEGLKMDKNNRRGGRNNNMW